MIVTLFLAVLLVAGVTTSLPDTKESKLAQASNDLAFDLMKFYKDEKNVFISPFSISTALGLVYLGTAGNSTKIMSDVLKYDKHGLSEPDVHQAYQTILASLKNQADGYTLSSSNNVFLQKNFTVLQNYTQALKQYYSAQIESTDFSDGAKIKARINSLVENATNGKIKDFLEQPPSADSKLFLLNAVYFLGNWKLPFNPNFTSKRPFYNNGVTAKQVDTMFRDISVNYAKSSELSARVIVLPYRGNDTASMVVVLPDHRNGSAELEKKLNKATFDSLLNSTRLGRVALSMPKFNLAYSAELGSALSHLGMGELFSNWANLTRMAGGANLKVGSIKHKAVIDVDEKGTEAAAATGIEIVPVSLPPRFAIDHPFLFYILDTKTGLILFSGKVGEL